MRAYVRRVQRLGTSSLVVTLPKEWVRRVGLKPGDAVLVVIEGSSVRIIPGAAEPLRRLVVDASRVPVGVSRLVSCAYVSRIDVLRLEGVDWEAALEARSAASRLPGVDVSSGPGFVEVRVVLDDSRVSPWELLGGLARLSVDLVGLIEKLSREPTPQLVQLAREAHNEIVKYEHLAVRLLSSPGPEQPLVYAAAALGNAAADLWSLASMLATRAETGLDTSLSQETLSLLKEAAKLAESISTPKPLDQLSRLADEAAKLRLRAHSQAAKADKPLDAAAATTAYRMARHIESAINLAICHAIDATREGEPSRQATASRRQQ